MVIPNCGITKQNSEVLESCTQYKAGNRYHIAYDIIGNNIYTLYDGTVVISNTGHIGQSVIVQTGMSFCIVYANLKYTTVNPGDYVSKGQQIGVANRYVHVEFLTKEPSDWVVRVAGINWYKQDPSVLFTSSLSTANNAQFDTLGIIELSDYPSGDYDKVNAHIDFILSNNEGA